MVSKRVAGRRVIVLFEMKFDVVRELDSVDVTVFSFVIVVVDISSVGGDAVISLSPRRGSLLNIDRTVVTSRSISVVVPTDASVGSVTCGKIVVILVDIVDVVGKSVVVIVDASVAVNILVCLVVINIVCLCLCGCVFE